MTPARRAALLRLLADWEAGRMTRASAIDSATLAEFRREKLVETWVHRGGTRIVDLLPTGIAAARREKDATTKEAKP